MDLTTYIVEIINGFYDHRGISLFDARDQIPVDLKQLIEGLNRHDRESKNSH